MEPLPPLPQPIGFFNEFVAQKPETIILKERILSISNDSYDVKLANGTPILNVKGKVFTVGARRSVYDMSGNYLFDIYREVFHVHTTYRLEDAQGNKFLELRNKIKTSFASRTTGKAESLTMKGNWGTRSAEIRDDTTGAIVARIDRKFLNARLLVFDDNSYGVTVAPGMDIALAVALCICLDDKNTDSR